MQQAGVKENKKAPEALVGEHWLEVDGIAKETEWGSNEEAADLVGWDGQSQVLVKQESE